MTNSNKVFWTPQQVFMHLEIQQKKGIPFSLPNNVYCTEDFKWNEVLLTKDKFFQMPAMEVLENLQFTMRNVIQPLRTKVGKPIRINSSWRTPAKQQDLINRYKIQYNAWLKNGKRGNPPNKPSETSLHLEGLAIDISVIGDNQKQVQSILNSTFAGEMELGWDYTHVGLTTFSKSYLQRHGLFREDIYKKLILDTTKLPKSQRDSIEKRFNPTNWNIRYTSTFDPVKNAEFFKNSTIGKKDVETTPKLPEVKIPLPDENNAEDNDIDDAGNSIDTENGGKVYLEGHVEINVPKEGTLLDIEQEQQTGYAAGISENTQAVGQNDNDNLPSWEKPLEGYEEPNVYLKNDKYTFDGELSDEEINKMDLHEKMAYYTKYLNYYYIKRLKTLAREQEQRDRLEIIRQQELRKQQEAYEYWDPKDIEDAVDEYLSKVFDSVTRELGYLK